jgi:uncharacterized Ntn-hydrolase superfamily protein
MKKLCIIFLLFFLVGFCLANDPIRPVNTFSIVAIDTVAGEMGVAVQSNWFSVGTVVSWAEAGVGAVATQSFVEISYGPLGLDLMRAGNTAPEALEALLTIDEHADVRQVAMVDAYGNVAVHTGEKCIREAGHFEGKGFTTQANLMKNNTVWNAMAKTFQNTKGDLLSRFMASLKAAQAEGGDIRGKQSAAILIVPTETNGQPWREKIVDLRIDDHPDPINEMERLVNVHRAYEYMNEGDELMTYNDIPGALEAYSAAHEIYPENMEILYWTAATMAGVGKVDEALPLFKKVFIKEPIWKEVTRRLPAADLLPDDPELMNRILNSDK